MIKTYYTLKAFLKRCVFNEVLKESTLGDNFNERGSAFHSLGPATEKALSPNFLDVEGSCKRNWAAERRVRGGWYSFNIDAK